MNFPVLINLSPITTVRVPEVPKSGEDQLSPCRALKKTTKKPVVALSQPNINLLTERNPDILGILRCQISADGSQQAGDEVGNQRGDTA